MRIFLIGYMGSGKSTIGKLLARKLKIGFIDFDEYIERKAGKTIMEIFDEEGERKFRVIEHKHLKKLLKKDNLVISLGGGTPCFYNNIKLINKNGISIYLDVSAAMLAKRLFNERSKRPLICNLKKTELRYFIKTNLEKRRLIYEQSHISIKAKNHNKEIITEKIIPFIKKYSA